VLERGVRCISSAKIYSRQKPSARDLKISEEREGNREGVQSGGKTE